MSMHRTVRVTKRFTFEMAHALRCHDGLCANIHGHSYVLDVTIAGTPAEAPGHPKDGMVIDFADLKRMVRPIVDRFDHALFLHERDKGAVKPDEPLFGRVILTPWQPTCENILLAIVEELAPQLPGDAKLVAARLQETATSWAEWEA
ncbi:MAG: 6-carboxytetrahydropterin synthase [Flavobacteriales bacterium]|jgi:6-pyruvoyltetrahydropterin/6-carboxytetrahydropterin synthase|nr:MAG: 6-carboxytetrahydropterin synthase [Flavobacteriales bacterium]